MPASRLFFFLLALGVYACASSKPSAPEATDAVVSTRDASAFACVSDDLCPGARCDVASGRCVARSCEAQADCPAGTRCNVTLQVCEPAGDCRTGDACPEGEACVAESGLCRPFGKGPFAP